MKSKREQERARKKSQHDTERALRTMSNVPSPGDVSDEELDQEARAAKAARKQAEPTEIPAEFRHVHPGEPASEVDEQSLPAGTVELDPSADEPDEWDAEEHKAAGHVHMAGEPGGGSPVGGLAGTNVGDGAMLNADSEDAMFEDEREHPQGAPPYAGHAGGAVGGTPAEKRATGAEPAGLGTEELHVPHSDRGDSTIGSNPPKRSRRRS